MIKSELVQRIATQNPHLYQRDVENIVNAILGEIIAAMARGDRVELRGFGAFSVKNRPARTGRNPRTGAHVAGREEVGAVLQDRQGNARAAQSSQRLVEPRRRPPERGMIRKIVIALILVPLAIILISFAVANRQTVVVSLDPFDQANPALSFTLPLFALILMLLIAGVIVGGIAAWLRQGRWRRAARHAEAQARELRGEVEELKAKGGAAAPPRSEYAQQLSIPPPPAA